MIRLHTPSANFNYTVEALARGMAVASRRDDFRRPCVRATSAQAQVPNLEELIPEDDGAISDRIIQLVALLFVLKAHDPVVTNLASSEDAWVRLESALVMNSTDRASYVLVSEIRQDILAYLRTVSLAQIQGPRGLL
jgi:hypothetical protein